MLKAWFLTVALCANPACEVPDYAAYPEVITAPTQPACEMMAVIGGRLEVGKINPTRIVGPHRCMTWEEWSSFKRMYDYPVWQRTRFWRAG